MKHYAAKDTGIYYGSANSTLDPAYFIEVPYAPKQRSKWNGATWEAMPDERTANDKAGQELFQAMDAKGLETVVAGLIKHLAKTDVVFKRDTNFSDLAEKARVWEEPSATP